MLHIVSKSPNASDALASCLRVVQPGAAILLIENGVYGATAGAIQLDQSATVKIYALAADVMARGLDSLLDQSVDLVDYEGFVELTERYPVTHTWH